MLFKLSLKNIRKSFKDYAIYFFTLILGVAIFYVFNAIDSQTVLLNVTSSTREIIDLMVNMLSGVSVFVSFILGFLIIYASRFLMKRRNKEFGIYLTLGMSKGKISKILLLETLIIGIISLVIGLVVGVGASQLMSVLVANSFEADLTEFTFVFSSSAMIKTIIYFGIMYLLVMIFNVINVGRCKLIDLIYANKKNEEVKMKNPVVCTIVFLISVCALGYAYYLVTAGVDTLTGANDIFIPIILGCVSTFFIFWSLSGLILKIVMSFKSLYYKGLNSFVLRQISSKVNTMVFSMTVICLMLFVTICVFSSSLSIKNSMTANLVELAPVDVELSKTRNISEEYAYETGYSEVLRQDSFRSIEESLNLVDFDVNHYFKDITTVYTYVSDDFTFEDTLGSAASTIKSEYPIFTYHAPEEIMKLSDYNKVARLYGNTEYALNSNEYMIIADFESTMEMRNEALKTNPSINVFGVTLMPKYDECQDGFVRISNSHINTGIIVVPDSIVDESYLEREILLANYKADSEEGKQAIEDTLMAIENHPYSGNITMNASTKISIYEASVGLGAMVTFIGLYLGIIFLISSAAILALKELSESTDNKERYQMLRKIGTDEGMINRALFKQIAIFFSVPLILAIIHSIFGIEFCKYILMTFGEEEMTKSITMTAIFLIIIYGGYFLITYYCSKNIIKDK
ncbi:MAG TPA: ABC transporter permease [Candidatus Caccenecus avistercoris]|nr:ABC transporter permease [Candidatus Caccenecus avistercoris]